MIFKEKNKFLKYEYEYHYKGCFNSYKEFCCTLKPNAIKCLNCGAYYWKDCKKQCKCKIN